MSWSKCKNILVIRPDNMGDLIMSGPAIRALKETFNAKITVLTSTMARGIITHMPEIDEAIIFDLPWVKTAETPDQNTFKEVIDELKERRFDAAVIFNVFSQNPLPTAMLAYLAGIPKVLAYCRENPYHLISNWVPDKEPYEIIKHQVRRDLDLVATVGATTTYENLHLTVDESLWPALTSKLHKLGLNVNQPWLILHAGVSEKKREYAINEWVKAAKTLVTHYQYQVLLTGSASEKNLTDELARLIGAGSLSAGGMFTLSELLCVIKHAPLMLSVNTGTIHIAAAMQTPLVVLYAQTNPQHTPWNSPCTVLPFAVANDLQSKNEVISYLQKTVYNQPVKYPNADDVVEAAIKMRVNNSNKMQADAQSHIWFK